VEADVPQDRTPNSTNTKPRKFAGQVRWLGLLSRSLALPVGLAVLSLVLVLSARKLYTTSPENTFGRQLAETLLQLAVVSAGGALLDIVAKSLATLRTDVDKRRDLLTRMRNAHVRIAHARRLLAAADSKKTYVDQMGQFLLIIPELEDIEQDVAASRRLFTERDRKQICAGIRQIVCYLERLCDEYACWATSRSHGSRWREQPEIADFLKEKRFPVEYDVGISLSKGVIRDYVFGYGDTTDWECPEPPPRAD
jgi:hypothetical protein